MVDYVKYTIVFINFQNKSFFTAGSHPCGNIDTGGFSTGMGQEDIVCVAITMLTAVAGVGHQIGFRVQ